MPSHFERPPRELPEALSELAVLAGPTRNGKSRTSIAYMAYAGALFGDTVILATDEIREPLWNDPDIRAQAWANPEGPERELCQKKIDDAFYPDDESWGQNVLQRRDVASGRPYLNFRQECQSRGLWTIANIPGRLDELMQNPTVGRVLLEGVHLLPEYIDQIREERPKARPLILINTDPAHKDVIVEDVRHWREKDPTQNWMCSWSDERITSFMDRGLEQSYEWQADADKYGIPYRDMRYGSLIDNALDNGRYLAYGTPLNLTK